MKALGTAALTFAFAVSAALAGCSAAPAPVDTAGAEKEVRQGALGVVAAYNAKDVDRAASYDASDYVGMFHGTQNVVGLKADAAAMKAQMDSGDVKWALGEGRVTVAQSGDFGMYEAPYTFSITNRQSGKTVTEAGNWVAIFRRQDDGTMKLWRSIGSDTPPPPIAVGDPST